MRNASGIAVVLGFLCACGRTPFPTDAGGGDASRDKAATPQRCIDVCEQLACDPELSIVSDSFTDCTASCAADRELAASVSPRCARAQDSFAECLLLVDCDELEMLEHGGIASCRVQTDDVARHCPGVEFELAG